MQIAQIIQRQRNHTIQILRRHQRCRQTTDGARVGHLQAAHDLRHHADERFAIAQPHRVGFGGGRADGDVALAGSLIRPHEHVAQQIGICEFMDAARKIAAPIN